MPQVHQLAERCDVLTCEIEHVSVDALKALEYTPASSTASPAAATRPQPAVALSAVSSSPLPGSSKPATAAAAALAMSVSVQPSAECIRVIQDKYLQKTFFQQYGLPVGDFREVRSEADILSAALVFGFPLMLKSKRMAYDGKGNCVVRSAADVPLAYQQLLRACGADSTAYSAALYVERWLDFEKELAVMVVRSVEGELQSYPLCETLQRVGDSVLCQPQDECDDLDDTC